MDTKLFLVQRCEEMAQKVYKGLIDKYEHLPHEETIILLMFRKIIEKADALNVLIESQCGRVTDSFARELLECYWQLLYLLEDDTNFRTLSYYYFAKRDKSSSVLQHIEYIENSGVFIDKASLEHSKMEHQQLIDYLDNDELFQEIRDEIAKKSERYVKWYSLKNRMRSIMALAIHLGKEDEYNSSYALFSGEVHGLTGTGHMDMEDDKAVMQPLRSIDEGEGRQLFGQHYLSLSLERFVEYFQLGEDYQKLRSEMAQRMHEDKMRGWDKRHEQLNEMIKELKQRVESGKENNPKVL